MEITLTLPATMVQQVIEILESVSLPHKVTDPLIKTIVSQVRRQQESEQ